MSYRPMIAGQAWDWFVHRAHATDVSWPLGGGTSVQADPAGGVPAEAVAKSGPGKRVILRGWEPLGGWTVGSGFTVLRGDGTTRYFGVATEDFLTGGSAAPPIERNLELLDGMTLFGGTTAAILVYYSFA